MKASSLPTTSISIIKRINREESSRIFEIRWQVFEQKSKAWKEYFLMLSRKCNPCPIKMLKEWTKIKTERKIRYIERRALRKHLICPYEQCDRRYSSQIALNCHLRTKHNEKKSRTWWNIRFINLFLLFRIWICYFLNLPAAWVINGPHETE